MPDGYIIFDALPLDVLRYLLELLRSDGCSFLSLPFLNKFCSHLFRNDTNTIEEIAFSAAVGGHFNLLRWIVDTYRLKTTVSQLFPVETNTSVTDADLKTYFRSYLLGCAFSSRNGLLVDYVIKEFGIKTPMDKVSLSAFGRYASPAAHAWIGEKLNCFYIDTLTASHFHECLCRFGRYESSSRRTISVFLTAHYV